MYDYIARYVIEREKKKRNITNCSLKKLKESKDINDLNKQWRLERISSRHKIDSRQQLRFINVTIVTSDSLNSKHNYIVTA